MKEYKFFRNCPYCNGVIGYYYLSTYNNGIKTNQTCTSKECRRCRQVENTTGDKNPMFGKTGDKNPFFNKKHSELSKEKISLSHKKNIHIYKTEDFRLKMSNVTSGANNPMYGKTVYQCWVKKYGKTIADEKMCEYKKKQSFNNSGCKNSMYGKPAPKKSGNGISGWYKEIYFRSLLELTYIIRIIERYNLKWETGESNVYKIQYTDSNGMIRNYFPDFIINGKYVVECKPKNLCNTPDNKNKANAAIEWCNKHGYKYKIFKTSYIKRPFLLNLIDTGMIVLNKKWDDKYKSGKL